MEKDRTLVPFSRLKEKIDKRDERRKGELLAFKHITGKRSIPDQAGEVFSFPKTSNPEDTGGYDDSA